MEKHLFDASQLSDNSIYAERVLNKALWDFQKEQILKKIDQSLIDRNKDEFQRLTQELKRFLEAVI